MLVTLLLCKQKVQSSHVSAARGKYLPGPLPLDLLPYTSRLLISFHLLRPMATLPQNPKMPLEAVSPLPDVAEGSARTWLLPHPQQQ